MHITIEKDELKKIIKIAIKEVLEEERIDSLLNLIPAVSKEEMEDIRKTYGKPNEKKKIAYTEELEI